MKVVVTSFDGDPFLLNFWLTLYQKYWRGEADRIYLSVYYNEAIIPPEVVAYNKKLLDQFKEIEVYLQPNFLPPEKTNEMLLKQVKADKVALIESDGFIFQKGLVERMFFHLDEYDVVSPEWDLIFEPYIRGDLGVKGFMRCFFFARKSLLEKIELDFMPKHIPAGTKLPNSERTTQFNLDLDCFGWISAQIALLRPKIMRTPANVLHPSNIEDSAVFEAFPWLHVRQMMSSALGLGGSEYGLWNGKNNEAIIERVFRLFDQDLPGGPAEFIHLKALAFRLLFWETLKNKQDLGIFAEDYRHVLEAVMDWYAFPRHVVYELKGYFKGLMKL